MDRILFGVLCLSGCLTFSTCLLHQYHFVSEAKTWTEAQSYCREKYTDLATVGNTEEMEELNHTVPAAGHRSQVWIGLYSHVDWKWSDGFNQSGAEYRNWRHNQPNYRGANQFCVGMNKDGKWFDRVCDVKLPSVCYRDSAAAGLDLVRETTGKTWSEAQTHCRQLYRELATVTNEADNDQIKDWMTENDVESAWIGLYGDPQIYWSDGIKFSFSSWSPGFNPPGSKEDVCGVADFNKEGKWRFISCEDRKPFVCYSMEQRGWCFLE